MGIVPEDVARVRAASDMVAIVGEHVALKRVGRRYQGLCPFHSEKSPSFSVNAAEGLYYCFGCGARGDVITFVRDVEHLEFAEAVERLAARAGVQVRYDDSPAAAAQRKRLGALRDALERAVDWYHQRLLSAPDGAAARQYLRNERGYDGEVVRAYRLGWAPDGWDALVRALRVPPDVMTEAGLAFTNPRGRLQDGFRGRVLFPIFDPRGEPIGLGGRSLPGGPPPKYRNSPEGPLYKKGRVLYGLNWAKGAAVSSGEIVVCEGYTDVIGLHGAGVPQAVATCGTALSEEHVQLLKGFAPRLVLAYDADAAGQAAAERVYGWEQRYGIEVAVAAFPAGEDPADLARRDPDALRASIGAARPFLAFRLDRVLGGADLRTPEGRARAADAALAVIREHPNDLVRDQYVMQVAQTTGIDPDRLRGRLRAGGGGSGGAGAGGSPSQARAAQAGPVEDLARPQKTHPAEIEALRHAVHEPEEVAARLFEGLFVPGPGRRAYRYLSEAETLHDAIAAADDAGDERVGALLQRVAVEEPYFDADAALAGLVTAAVERVKDQAGPALPWIKSALQELGDGATRRDATDRLVRWLAERLGKEG